MKIRKLLVIAMVALMSMPLAAYASGGDDHSYKGNDSSKQDDQKKSEKKKSEKKKSEKKKSENQPKKKKPKCKDDFYEPCKPTDC